MSKKKQIIFSSLLGIVLLVVIFMPKKETTEPLDEIEVTDSLEVKEIIRGVYRIVHKKLERKCERKACKYKEFERFEGDLGKKNEMYTGLICFNLV